MPPLLCSLGVLVALGIGGPQAQPAAKRLYAVAVVPAPVVVIPDASRVPLRTLTPGTRVKVLRDQGDWFRVEFADPLWGPRVGYVQKKHVQLAEPDVDADTPTVQPPPAPPAPAKPPTKKERRSERA